MDGVEDVFGEVDSLDVELLLTSDELDDEDACPLSEELDVDDVLLESEAVLLLSEEDVVEVDAFLSAAASVFRLLA